jgi:peptide/nickel transport system substrate-binding protein
MLDYEKGGADSYSTGYNNPEMNELVQAAQREFDPEARQEIYSEIQALHANEVPHVPLVFQQTTFAWTDEVQGFFVNPVGNRHLEDVWLATE